MDYNKKVEAKEKELTELHLRMDKDEDLVNLKSYVMTDKRGTPVPNIINVTLNDAAVFDATVESNLGASTEQIVVETQDTRLDTTEIEEFIIVLYGTTFLAFLLVNLTSSFFYDIK